ncbi:MAG: dimethyl sulfoxide reductase anchor subunit [Burkholderiales bacterium]|nr:MAG: dimethyl sulfoxide reductase anchor subunit [Burkholderiales bacterium]
MSFGPNPWQQQNWDWRAACNFMCGGAGAGLIVFAALAGAPRWMLALGVALIGLGLLAVWAEIGRPWRAVNVLFNARTSWMTREALVAPLVVAAAALAWLGVSVANPVAALLALAFVYCQARIVQACRGIPAWREPSLVPLLVATGLAEGGALLLLPAVPVGRAVWLGFALALLARLVAWGVWRRRIEVVPRALAAIDAAGQVFKASSLLALVVALSAMSVPQALAVTLQVAAGLLAVGGGLWFKYTLITRAGFNQGFALAHLPVRAARRG